MIRQLMTTHLMLREARDVPSQNYFTLGSCLVYSTLAVYIRAAKLVYARVAYDDTHRLKKRMALSS